MACSWLPKAPQIVALQLCGLYAPAQRSVPRLHVCGTFYKDVPLKAHERRGRKEVLVDDVLRGNAQQQ